MDWLDNKRAKALRIFNDREAFQLNKMRRSLDSMKVMNENLRKQEERKVRKWLRKQSEASPSPSYKALHYQSSGDPETTQDQISETRPQSGKESIDLPWNQFGDHLPNFVSFLRLPTKRISNDRKLSKDQTPFSGTDIPTQAISARNANAPRNSLYNNSVPPNRDAKKGSSPRQSLEKSLSFHEVLAFFPSLQKLSTRGDRFLVSSLYPYSSVAGLPPLPKKQKSTLGKEPEEERFKMPESLPQIKPEEILSCRYLRLSQSNIDTLLQLCKESGINIDLHPHMKESDIDVSTVLSSTANKLL